MKKSSKLIIGFGAYLMASMLLFTTSAYAGVNVKENLTVIVDGSEAGKVAALEVDYDNNIFVSIKGIAYELRNSAKAFNVSVASDEITISTGENYSGDYIAFTDEELENQETWKQKRTTLYLNGVEKKYYSLIGKVGEEGELDAFFSPARLAIMLDGNISVDDDAIYINTNLPFQVSGAELENSGYLQGINSILTGDGSTGNIFFSHDENKVLPIASTTKLMTYFVLMDAVSNGEVSLDDMVSISSNAVKLSNGTDGLIPLDGISAVPLSELVYAMLLPSCNECALAIAEHVSGSEKAFVERMNEKAKSLGLETAEFYNSNGLPVYTRQVLPAKMQNHMSSTDMFTMASELIKAYPEVLDITSTKIISLPTLHYEAKNTNALLYNMDGVKGLKTGTTNKSGACLVSVLPVEKDGEIHNLITVVLGAEGEYDRALVSELAMKLSISKLDGVTIETEEKYTITPQDPETDVLRMLRNLK